MGAFLLPKTRSDLRKHPKIGAVLGEGSTYIYTHILKPPRHPPAPDGEPERAARGEGPRAFTPFTRGMIPSSPHPPIGWVGRMVHVYQNTGAGLTVTLTLSLAATLPTVVHARLFLLAGRTSSDSARPVLSRDPGRILASLPQRDPLGLAGG